MYPRQANIFKTGTYINTTKFTRVFKLELIIIQKRPLKLANMEIGTTHNPLFLKSILLLLLLMFPSPRFVVIVVLCSYPSWIWI